MIEMPAESIDGVVLGAVEFKKKNTKETKKTKGVSLKMNIPILSACN